jgi:hypothetical protein
MSPNDLCARVIRLYGRRLTDWQLRTPWTYVGSDTNVITGVIVPPDEDKPGFRVIAADMERAP